MRRRHSPSRLGADWHNVPRNMGGSTMDYQQCFEHAIARLRSENRYRVFADLERDAAHFPIARWRPDLDADSPRDITVWCSNDYLGMGSQPKVVAAAIRAVERHGAGAGGTRNIS